MSLRLFFLRLAPLVLFCGVFLWGLGFCSEFSMEGAFPREMWLALALLVLLFLLVEVSRRRLPEALRLDFRELLSKGFGICFLCLLGGGAVEKLMVSLGVSVPEGLLSWGIAFVLIFGVCWKDLSTLKSPSRSELRF